MFFLFISFFFHISFVGILASPGADVIYDIYYISVL